MSALDPCFSCSTPRHAAGFAALAELHDAAAAATPTPSRASFARASLSTSGEIDLSVARKAGAPAPKPAEPPAKPPTKPSAKPPPAKPAAQAKPAAPAKPQPAASAVASVGEPPKMSEAEIAACAVEQTVSATQQRLISLAADIGLTSAIFRRVRDDYYEQELAWRRDAIGAASVKQLCKSMIMENTKLVDKPLAECLAEGKVKFVCVVVQYEGAKLHKASP